jgi:hypothetical protein
MLMNLAVLGAYGFPRVVLNARFHQVQVMAGYAAPCPPVESVNLQVAAPSIA